AGAVASGTNVAEVSNRDVSTPPSANRGRIVLISPQTGASYHISPELPPEQQALSIEAELDVPDVQEVRLLVDGIAIATATAPPFRATWQLVSGTHSVVAVATTGDGATHESSAVRITVER
ncbi:MAG: Ig-like domain-containing protein, partial [Dehalococcoidia bacterium]